MKQRKLLNYIIILILVSVLTSCGKSTETFNAETNSLQNSKETTDLTKNKEEENIENDEAEKASEQEQSTINKSETIVNYDQTTMKLEVPSNILTALEKLDSILSETEQILKQLESDMSIGSNIYAEKNLVVLRNQLLDQYSASGKLFRDITLYRYFDTQSLDNPIKDDIYTYGTIYQDAMYHAQYVTYRLKVSRKKEEELDWTISTFNVRHKEANELLEKIKENINEGPPIDLTNVYLDENTHPVLLLDALWIKHQEIWKKQGEFIYGDTEFSTLTSDDALEEIDELITNSKIIMENLKMFSKDYQLEKYDEWNLEEANGILDNWYTAVNNLLYAIQIYGNKQKLEEYYGGENFIPNNSAIIKYDIRAEVQALNFKEFEWQYTRGREFLRNQEKASSTNK